MKLKLKHYAATLLTLAMVNAPAHADPLQKVTGFFGDMESILRGASVSVVTLAIMIVGYQMLFGGKTFRDCFPIVIAALVIGGGAEFARYMMA